MSEYKMVENRKYNDEEIKYVVSRLHASWAPETIAKAFKQDHGEYWAGREFTKKQVAYIRSSYKTPPGVIKPYTGPVPVFTPSPSPEDSPQPASSSNRKRKRASEIVHGHARSSSSSYVPVYDQSSSPIAGPSRKRQRADPSGDWPSSDPLDTAQLASPGSPNLFQASTYDMPGANNNNVQDLFDADPSVDDLLTGFTYSMDAFEADMASGDLNLDVTNPNMVNPGASGGQSPSIPDLNTLLPDIPVQSIEGNQSATGAATNTSALPNPQQQQANTSNPQAQFPIGCARAGAVARDARGVWYYNPHDSCSIRLGHRHDMDGGIYFTCADGVTQSLLAMDRQAGIGFSLGVAMVCERILNNNGGGNGSIDPEALMRQTTQLVREYLPQADDVSGVAVAPLIVPRPEFMRGLTELNRHLPAGLFYDPYYGRVVDLFDSAGAQGGGGGGQGGAAGSSGSNQGTGTPGAAPL